jgi:hypothetical protein
LGVIAGAGSAAGTTCERGQAAAGENRDAPISTVIASRVGSDEQAIEGFARRP